MQPAARNVLFPSTPLPSFAAFLPFGVNGIDPSPINPNFSFGLGGRAGLMPQLSPEFYIQDYWRAVAQRMLMQQAYSAGILEPRSDNILPADVGASHHGEKREAGESRSNSEFGAESDGGSTSNKKARRDSLLLKERRRR
jgi:hypothetical protein